MTYLADPRPTGAWTVRKALIPCGGRGTRMKSLTGGGAKELLPVAGKPVLRRVAEECAAGAITDLLVVIAPDKDDIVGALSPLAGTPGMPERIHFMTQEHPRGLADAIRLGRDFGGGDPFVVALPDNLYVGARSGVEQVLDGFERRRTNVVAVVEISAAEASRRGPTSVLTGTLEGDDFRMARIPPKGTTSSTFDTGGEASAFTAVGRYVFLPEVFAVIDQVERELQPGAELDDIPVMRRLMEAGRLIGRRIEGRFLDVGIPDGYAEAEELLSKGL